MELYYVKDLARTTPPEGCGKGPWWRYTIECGSSESHSISGVREGKKAEVEKYLDKMLESINRRTLGHQSKKLRHSHLSPRQRPAKQVFSGRQRIV